MARPPNADAEVTRGRIRDAALHLFSAHGAGSTSVRDVAKRAGVSLAMVHHYFGSKDELYATCISATYAELSSMSGEIGGVLSAGEGLDRTIEDAVATAYRFARKHRVAVRLLLRIAVESGEVAPEGRAVLVRYLDAASQALAPLLGRPAEELRLPLQSIVFLAGRYAIASDTEVSVVTAELGAKTAHDAIERHLQQAALSLLGVARTRRGKSH